MAYARFGERGSDVYVYLRTDGKLVCQSDGRAFECSSRQGMIDHLEFHRRRGHHVPQEALDRLKAERDGLPYETDVERSLRAMMALPRRDDDYTPEAMDRTVERR